MNRRRFLGILGLAPLAAACVRTIRDMPGVDLPAGTRVNDVHAQINATQVARVVQPTSEEALSHAVWSAGRQHTSVAIAGGRHAMGGQQFLTDGWLIDTRAFDRVLAFDAERGLVTAQSGILWPALMAYLETTHAADGTGWGIVQKQTGADRLSLGGALAANAHGRVLTRPPIVGDVASFTLIGPGGEPRTVSRTENAELFGLAIGGYGLFGPISDITLRLTRRRKLRRHVAETWIDEVPGRLDSRIADGHTYGDFQFAIDPNSEGFLKRGILSTYSPVADDTPIPLDQRRLEPDDWRKLLLLTHTDPSAALDVYLRHYRATDGQIYWSDTQQLGFYEEDYHQRLSRALGDTDTATEVISELYVPLAALADFMDAAGALLRRHAVPVVYGTVRRIRRDTETFLPWARQEYACVVLNLHTVHTAAGLRVAAEAFRGLIDLALDRDGSFFLTYHRFATRSQIETAYPQMRDFLEKKLTWDAGEVFQSDWYRHMRTLFEA